MPSGSRSLSTTAPSPRPPLEPARPRRNVSAYPKRWPSADHCIGLVGRRPGPAPAPPPTPLNRLGHVHFRARALEDAAVLLAQRATRTPPAPPTPTRPVSTPTSTPSWDLRRADARLRPLGIRRGIRGTRRHHTTGWEALTPTETRIAELVAAGKSNPDIAGDLYLSRRTVESHVSHILSKLECRSRIDIARQAITRG